MIFDIYEQADLFKIAKCGRQSTLIDWLKEWKIPFARDSKQKVIAHQKAVEVALGVEHNDKLEKDVALWLGDDAA